jgi:hypothetical protein
VPFENVVLSQLIKMVNEVTALCDWQKHECDLRGTLRPAQRSPSGFFLILAANSTRRLTASARDGRSVW